MKKILILILLSIVTLGAFASERMPQDVQELWERGGRLYSAGDYNGAVATYDSIVSAGWESAPLYYNLGCAHFKAGKGGKAILNYYRAERLAPSDDDVAYNLAYAQSFVKDKIEAVPEFVVSRWLGSVKHLMSVDGWGVVTLVLLGVVLVAVGFFILAERRKVRKAGFAVGVVAALVLILSLGIGGSARRSLVSDEEAVVLSTAAVVKASPERTGKDLFILHEGTKVEVLDAFGEWSEIRIADGSKGWIRSSAMEVI